MLLGADWRNIAMSMPQAWNHYSGGWREHASEAEVVIHPSLPLKVFHLGITFVWL